MASKIGDNICSCGCDKFNRVKKGADTSFECDNCGLTYKLDNQDKIKPYQLQNKDVPEKELKDEKV